jgi:hypothetical protein
MRKCSAINLKFYARYEFSWRISELRFSRAISHVSGELKINVSEIFSVSIIRVYVVNDCKSLKFSQVSNRFHSIINGSKVFAGPWPLL